MPTLPLYDCPAHPDAWHRVRAPGGFEWWHFAATDASRELRIEIDFFDGDPFSACYQSAYARYRRKPTRHAPPVPRDYPGVRVRTFERGKPLLCEDAPHPPGSLTASEDGLEIRVGSHVMRSDGAGTFHLAVSSAAELTFRRDADGYGVTGKLLHAGEVAFAGRGTFTHRFGTEPIDAVSTRPT